MSLILSNVQSRLASADSATQSMTFAYTHDGIRRSKMINGQTYRYLIDPNTPFAQVLYRYNEVLEPDRTYTYGRGLLSRFENGQIEHYHADVIGSTRALTRSGSATDRYSYDAFGNLTTHSGNSSNTFRFASEQYDSDLELYNLRARYIDTATGRFYGRDPFKGYTNDPQTLHDYNYAANNPLRYVDPSGKSLISNVFALTEVGLIARNVYSSASGAKKAYGAFKKLQKNLCKEGEKEARDWHHIYPIFVGGRSGNSGAIMPLDHEFHKQFHQFLHYILKFSGYAGGMGRGASKAKYHDLHNMLPLSYSDVQDILIEVAERFQEACEKQGHFFEENLAQTIKQQINDGKWTLLP